MYLLAFCLGGRSLPLFIENLKLFLLLYLVWIIQAIFQIPDHPSSTENLGILSFAQKFNLEDGFFATVLCLKVSGLSMSLLRTVVLCGPVTGISEFFDKLFSFLKLIMMQRESMSDIIPSFRTKVSGLLPQGEKSLYF